MSYRTIVNWGRLRVDWDTWTGSYWGIGRTSVFIYIDLGYLIIEWRRKK